MPRSARKVSKTGIYHVMLRGINKQDIFKRIGCRYVYWYNLKHQRSEHLFQDRYKSEIIENESYFLTVLRYIIQNPMKAGIEAAPGNYPWSSYKSYLGKADRLTDTGFVQGMFRSAEELIKFLNLKEESEFMDIREKPGGITDEKAGELVRELTGCGSLSEFLKLEKELLERGTVPSFHISGG